MLCLKKVIERMSLRLLNLNDCESLFEPNDYKIDYSKDTLGPYLDQLIPDLTRTFVNDSDVILRCFMCNKLSKCKFQTDINFLNWIRNFNVCQSRIDYYLKSIFSRGNTINFVIRCMLCSKKIAKTYMIHFSEL